jgi:hypothetical protein
LTIERAFVTDRSVHVLVRVPNRRVVAISCLYRDTNEGAASQLEVSFKVWSIMLHLSYSTSAGLVSQGGPARFSRRYASDAAKMPGSVTMNPVQNRSDHGRDLRDRCRFVPRGPRSSEADGGAG